MDTITAALTASSLHYQPSPVLDTVLSIRTHLFELAPKIKGLPGLFWIETAPTLLRRHALRDALHAEVIVLETPSHVCKQRILSDANRDQTYDWCTLIDDWWKKYERSSLDVVISYSCERNQGVD